MVSRILFVWTHRQLGFGRAMDALPISLSEGRVLRRDVAKDEVISFNDVDKDGDPAH